MATHDYVLANQSGSSFRSDLNNALAAIVSQNSSATEPATTYAYQYWIDTSATPALVKQRNAANDAWITLAEVDGQTLIADGDNAKPGLAFASDTDTGIRRESANEMSFVTNGSRRVTVDSSGSVGFGTSSPSTNVDVSDDTPRIRLTDTDTALSDGEVSSAIEFYQSDTSGAGLGASVVARGDGSTGKLALCFNANNDSEKMRIAASGNVGIGTTNPGAKLVVVGEDTTDDIAIHAKGGDGATTTTLLLDGDGDAGDVLIRARANVTASPGNTETTLLHSGEGKLGVGAYQSTSDLVGSFCVKSNGNYSESNGNTSASIFLENRNGSTGSGNYGPGISFSKINSGRPGGAISSVQTSGDIDQLGLAFFTHSASNSSNALVEQFRISHNGNLYGNDTTISSFSDERLKENVADFSYNLETFKQFQPKSFDWKNPECHGDRQSQIGFIAQQLEIIDTEWTGEIVVKDGSIDAQLLDEDRVAKTSSLGRKDAMYVSVIQQLLSKIETLETKVAALEAAS